MKFQNLPVGNVFAYHTIHAVKVFTTSGPRALFCDQHGVLGLKRLVRIVRKVDEIQDSLSEILSPVAQVECGTIVEPPHQERRYLVTSGVTVKGIVVSLLGMP